jgi:hypothetical protein
MRKSLKGITEMTCLAGMTCALILAVGKSGQVALDREFNGLNQARLISENPREVLYDSDGDGKIDTSRKYFHGPKGGLFHYDKPIDNQ